MKRAIMICGLALALTITIAASSMAQRGQGGGQRGGPQGGGPGGPQGGGPGMMMMGRGGPGGNTGMLLGNPQIREEIGLTEAQQKQLEEARSGIREQFAGMRDLDQEQRQTKMQEIMEKMQKDVDSVLTEKQRTRLSQIQLQTRGVGGAIGDEKVQKELGLTSVVIEKAETIRNGVREAMSEQFSGMREKMQNASPEQRQTMMEEMRTKMETIRTQTTEKLEALLSPEQKEKLQKMMGPKFEMQRPEAGQNGQQRMQQRGQRGGEGFRPQREARPNPSGQSRPNGIFPPAAQ